ncbi:ras-related protein RABC2a-like [Lycium barbarum]|uniref:ras-related protein RABC2a-like n=1 Tax=Lycium barbarum TaxID=112863 RepID=UPI00293E5FF7|nr:ras-related protein RABC2a-like [Lycium barbarum]
MVYDVTRRETFTNLSETWAKDIKFYSTNRECIKMLVGNKVDRESERAVTREEGLAFAKEHNCLFLECSARTRENVQLCFKDLTLKIMDVPSLVEKGSAVVKNQILKQKEIHKSQHSGNSVRTSRGDTRYVDDVQLNDKFIVQSSEVDLDHEIERTFNRQRKMANESARLALEQAERDRARNGDEQGERAAARAQE